MRVLGFQIIKAPPSGAQSVEGQDRGRWWWPVIREPFTGAWQRNIEVRTDTVLTFGAVYACINRISSDIAKLRIKLVQQDENDIWSETEAPAFSPVLRKPNHYQNRIQFLQLWMTSKLINGNAYILKTRDQRGVVVGLYVLDPTRVKVLVTPSGDIYYEVAKDYLSDVQDTVTLPASEIIHDRMNTFHHPLCGVSPIYAAGLSAIQGIRIQSNSTQFFQNMSVPSGVLTAPGVISEQTAKRIKDAWETNFSGGKGGVAVLGDGLAYEQMTISATDAQMLEQLKWTAENVCTAFGVPAYMVGVGPAPTYNNIEALNQQYYAQCLQIYIEALELCLDEGLGLVTISGKEYGTELDLDGLLRMDSVSLYETLSKGVNAGVLAPNEGRKKLDLKPVPGGDTPYLQQQNYSLAALDKRDSQEDPFAAKTTPSSAPAPDQTDQAATDSTEPPSNQTQSAGIDWDHEFALLDAEIRSAPIQITIQPGLAT